MINYSQIPPIDSSTHLQIIESPTSPKATRYTCQKAMGKACIVTSVACAILGGSAAIGALTSGLIGSSPKCGVLAGLHSGLGFPPCALAVIYCVHSLSKDHVQHKHLMRLTYFVLLTIGVLLPMLLACRDAHSCTPFPLMRGGGLFSLRLPLRRGGVAPLINETEFEDPTESRFWGLGPSLWPAEQVNVTDRAKKLI